MTGVTSMEQRVAVTPLAALVGPAMLPPMSGNDWPNGIATSPECDTAATHGFTAKRSTRHFGRLST